MNAVEILAAPFVYGFIYVGQRSYCAAEFPNVGGFGTAVPVIQFVDFIAVIIETIERSGTIKSRIILQELYLLSV